MRVKEIDLDKLVEEDILTDYHGRVIDKYISLLFERTDYDTVKIRTSKKVTTKFIEAMTTANISGYETLNGNTVILVTYPNTEDDWYE